MKMTQVAAIFAAISLAFSAMANEPTGNAGNAPTEEKKPETAAATKKPAKKGGDHKK
jgi:hypothetical protein